MLGRTLGKILAVIGLLTAVAVVPVSLWQRHRTLDEIGTVSQKFIVSASKLDLLKLRECITSEGRTLMPAYYTCVAAHKLSELNSGVRVSVRTKIVETKLGSGEATVRVKREVIEHGTRLGKRVDNQFADEYTVICAYDGERWLVDLERMLKNEQFPVANISLFKECLRK